MQSITRVAVSVVKRRSRTVRQCNTQDPSMDQSSKKLNTLDSSLDSMKSMEALDASFKLFAEQSEQLRVIKDRIIQQGLHGWKDEAELHSDGTPLFLRKLAQFALVSHDPMDVIHAQYLFTHRTCAVASNAKSEGVCMLTYMSELGQ